MGISTQTPKAQSVLSSEIRITNPTLINKNTIYNYPLIDNLKQIRIRSRKRFAVLKYSFTIGGGDNIKIDAECREEIENLNFIGKTLYIESDEDNTEIEIVEFY